MPRKSEGFEDQDFLGGRVSTKIPVFKEIACLGYEEAEQYQIIDFIEWFVNNPQATMEKILKELIKRVGQAHFLKLTSEITKLSMILGYKLKEKTYNE